MSTIYTEKNESSSSDAVYTTVVMADGRLGCDCKGWTILNKNGNKKLPGRPVARFCGHHETLVAKKNWTVEVRGEYAYVVGGTLPQSNASAMLVRKSAVAAIENGSAITEARRLAAGVDAKPVKPMLAVQQDHAAIANWTEWAIEEKFDGHRAIVMVVAGEVTAWSRSGKVRELPPHVEHTFKSFPNGIYDGELMGREGGNFSDVRRLETQDEAYFVVFDILNDAGGNVMALSYDERRKALLRAFKTTNTFVRLAESLNLTSEADVVTFVGVVWGRGGEGAILKRRSARYQAGKRSPDFVKIKKGGSEVTTVVGFERGENGPYSVVVCVGIESGIATTVKTKNNKELAKFAAQAGPDPHPAIGKKLRIEYTSRDENAYTNPRWDRWEEE